MPESKTLYYADVDKNIAHKAILESHDFIIEEIQHNSLLLKPKSQSDKLIKIVGSRSHMSQETTDFINTIKAKGNEVEVVSKGSSLKFYLVAEGKADMKNLLGGKGANLAEMNLIGVPVPPGFTVTTEICTYYNTHGEEQCFELIKEQVEAGVAHLEKIMGTKFGDVENPLLLSVRSGARVSMPGMMDTVLNLGLNDEIVEGMVAKTG